MQASAATVTVQEMQEKRLSEMPRLRVARTQLGDFRPERVSSFALPCPAAEVVRSRVAARQCSSVQVAEPASSTQLSGRRNMLCNPAELTCGLWLAGSIRQLDRAAASEIGLGNRQTARV